MPIINCKIEFSLKWYENYTLSSAGTAVTLAITDTKLYVPVGTLKIEDNVKLSKLSSEEFKRSVYWNKYIVISNRIYNANVHIRELLDSSCQGVKRLFVFPYMRGDNFTTEVSCNKYFLPRLKIDNYNIKIDGRSFYDQQINDSIKQ